MNWEEAAQVIYGDGRVVFHNCWPVGSAMHANIEKIIQEYWRRAIFNYLAKLEYEDVNERITINSNDEVTIRTIKDTEGRPIHLHVADHHKNLTMRLSFPHHGNCHEYLDRRAMIALQQAITCALYSQDFAALSDQSAVPFAGAIRKFNGKEVRVIAMEPTGQYCWITELAGANTKAPMLIHTNVIEPRTVVKFAEPVRPWTLEEVWPHLGKWAVTPTGKRYRLGTVRPDRQGGFEIGCYSDAKKVWFALPSSRIVAWKMEETSVMCCILVAEQPAPDASTVPRDPRLTERLPSAEKHFDS